MNFDNDNSYYPGRKSSAGKTVLACLLCLLAVTGIIGIVLVINAPTAKKGSVVRVGEPEQFYEDEGSALPEGEYTGSGLTSDDLDFWGMYDDRLREKAERRSLSEDKAWRDEYRKNSGEEEAPDAGDTDEVSANGVDESGSDGETFDAADDGEPELIEIEEEIPKNSYEADFFRQEGQELQYYTSGRKTSSYGIDVSKYQGKIDWERVALSGIDFAMIRMGVRGYSSGNVVFDEEFDNNIKGANEHGIETGIYFYSQAISTQEAVEEANYAVAAAAANKVTYPIVFYTEAIGTEAARTDSLSQRELSDIAKAFCDAVRGYGYRAMIGGSKNRLSTALSPADISGEDVWLVDVPKGGEDGRLNMSEYPYRYTMWQYSSSGQIDGIEGNVDLDISFVDYKYR